MLKEQEVLAYMDADKSLEEKNEGNKYFTNGEYRVRTAH